MVPNWMGGVEAFLVIGAFFLTNKQLKTESRHNIIIGSGFLHRLKRLYPIYITLLIIIFSVCFVVAKRQLIIEVSWYLFSLQNFRCFFESSTYHLDYFIGHFWYIGLDVWLFLIWLALLRFVPRERLRLTFIITLSIGLLWRTLFILGTDNLLISYMIPIGQLDCWSIGGLLALNINEKGKDNNAMWVELIVGLVGCLLIITYNALIHETTFHEGFQLFKSAGGYMDNLITGNIHFFIALSSAGFLRYCIDTTRNHPVLSAAPLVTLGGMTYELYCFHYPIIVVVRHYLDNDLVIVLSVLMLTIAASLLWRKFASPSISKLLNC